MDMNEKDRAMLSRIDERTANMIDAFTTHVGENREDIKEIHSRINRISAKTNWIIGAGSILGVILGGFGTWLKDTLSGGGSV